MLFNCLLLLVAATNAFQVPANQCIHPDDCFYGYDGETREYVTIPAEYVTSQQSHPRRERRDLPSAKIPDHWPRLYVHIGGLVDNKTLDESKTVLVAATPLTKYSSLERGAEIVARQTKYMDSAVFSKLTSQATILGIFAHQEKLTVYPTFKHMASRDCWHSCDGSCRHTCVSLGRKTEDLAGLGGSGIAVVKEDNVACMDFDNYRKGESILVHEFAHAIRTAFTGALSTAANAAYHEAKDNQTWNTHSYAMSNGQEYWAEASQVWYGVTKDNRSFSGGMNLCNGSGPVCQTDKAGQEFIKKNQPKLYAILLQVYNSGHADIDHGLTICPKGRGIDWRYH